MTLSAAIEISFVARHPSSPPLHHPWRRPPCQIPLALTVASLTPPSIAAPLRAAPARPPGRRTRLFFIVAGPWSHFVFSRFPVRCDAKRRMCRQRGRGRKRGSDVKSWKRPTFVHPPTRHSLPLSLSPSPLSLSSRCRKINSPSDFL